MSMEEVRKRDLENRQKKQQKKENRRDKRDSQRQFNDGNALKGLRSSVLPKEMTIPYGALLSPNGYMNKGMQDRVQKRHKFLMDELEKIKRIAEKFNFKLEE